MIESKFNCPYCNRPITQRLEAAFPTNGMTMAQLEHNARHNGADPDRVDYSQCTDYRPEDERLEQNGQGWAEPPDETSHSNTPPRPRIMNGFEMARWVVDTYVDGSKIREKVNARIAEAEAQYAERLNRILPVNLRTYSAPK